MSPRTTGGVTVLLHKMDISGCDIPDTCTQPLTMATWNFLLPRVETIILQNTSIIVLAEIP